MYDKGIKDLLRFLIIKTAILEIRIACMHIHLTKKQEEYIQQLISIGIYKDASDIMEEALKMHESRYEKKLLELRTEIDNGWEGSTSKRSVSDIISAKLES